MSLFSWRSKSADAGKTKLPAIDGFVAKQGERGEIVFHVKSATFESFLGILNWLPEDLQLHFYDQYFPSHPDDDPGAYISVQRKAQPNAIPVASFRYMMGNHGWSSEWREQSSELLAAWMTLNLRAKAPRPRRPLTDVTVKKAIRSAWDGSLLIDKPSN